MSLCWAVPVFCGFMNELHFHYWLKLTECQSWESFIHLPVLNTCIWMVNEHLFFTGKQRQSSVSAVVPNQVNVFQDISTFGLCFLIFHHPHPWPDEYVLFISSGRAEFQSAIAVSMRSPRLSSFLLENTVWTLTLLSSLWGENNFITTYKPIHVPVASESLHWFWHGIPQPHFYF